MPLTINVKVPVGVAAMEVNVSVPMQQIQSETPEHFSTLATQMVNDIISQSVATASLLSPATSTPTPASAVDAAEVGSHAAMTEASQASISEHNIRLQVLIPETLGESFGLVANGHNKVSTVLDSLPLPSDNFVVVNGRKPLHHDRTFKEEGVEDGDTLGAMLKPLHN